MWWLHVGCGSHLRRLLLHVLLIGMRLCMCLGLGLGLVGHVHVGRRDTGPDGESNGSCTARRLLWQLCMRWLFGRINTEQSRLLGDTKQKKKKEKRKEKKKERKAREGNTDGSCSATPFSAVCGSGAFRHAYGRRPVSKSGRRVAMRTYLDQILALGLGDEGLQLGCRKGVDQTRLGNNE